MPRLTVTTAYTTKPGERARTRFAGTLSDFYYRSAPSALYCRRLWMSEEDEDDYTFDDDDPDERDVWVIFGAHDDDTTAVTCYAADGRELWSGNYEDKYTRIRVEQWRPATSSQSSSTLRRAPVLPEAAAS